MYGRWESTSRFQTHEPCPKCGSKDNLARYEGGSGYCFGCGFYEPGTGYRPRKDDADGLQQLASSSGQSKTLVRPPPDDCDFGGYPERVIEWIAKYGLSVRDLIFRDVAWSKKREQLIYQFYGEGDDLVLWQARNFRDGTTHKDRFFTGGSPADVIATYRSRKKTDAACLVEDCISGIVVANSGSADGIPCFSAAMSEKKLARIAKLYRKVYVWLDQDKLKESQKIARQLGLMGVTTRVLHTAEDPKCYPLDYIEAKLV